MPAYDFRCKKCRKKFSLTMTISQYEKRRAKCPKCKSTQVEQEWRPFFAVTSKKS